MVSVSLSTLTRPSSPPISVLARPPLLPGRSPASSETSSSNSGQSLSSVLSTPADSIDGHSKRNSRGAPPSAFQRSRYSGLPPSLFDGKDTRSAVLDTLKSIETEWELVAPSSVIPVDVNPSPKRNKRKKGGRKPPPTMSTADPSRQGVQKKPSFLRRLTQSSQSDPTPPPPSAAPPQIPRLSTFFGDDNTTFVASVTKPVPASGDPAASFMGDAGGFMAGTKFSHSPSPPHTPSPPLSHSLPPGAAPAASTSLANGPAWRSPPTSGFRVQNRQMSQDGPISAPHARPNGTPIANMHRQENGMLNGNAKVGPRPISSGMVNGAPHGPPNGLSNATPKALPSSPPQTHPKQHLDGTANGFVIPKPLPTSPPMAPPKQLPNSPPMAPPKQLPNSPPMAPPQQFQNGASMRPLSTTVPNGVRANGPLHAPPAPNGSAMPNGYFSPAAIPRPGPPPNLHYQQHQPPPLPPGAAHRAPPAPALASPPMSPPMSPNSTSSGGFPQQVYSRPPLWDANRNSDAPQPPLQSSRPLPQRTSSIHISQPRTPRAAPPQLSAQLNSGPHSMQPPAAMPNTQPSSPSTNRGLRPSPAPPLANGEALRALNGNSAPMITRPARSTSVGQANAAMSPPNAGRPLPETANSPPGAWTSLASGATVHVIASSDPRRITPATHPVAPPPSSAAPQNIAPAGNTASRPKITIPSNSTSPPPRPQPYTGPVLAAATAAVTPEKVAPFHAQQAPRGQSSDLMSPIEFTTSSFAAVPERHAKPASISGVGNGIPPAPAAALAGSQLPPRTRSSAIQARRIVSSPLASPTVSVSSSPNRTTHTSSISSSAAGSRSVSASTTFSSRTQSVASSSSTARASSVMDRPRPQLRHKSEKTVTYLLTHPRITMSLLPFLNINSFLNLLGSDDELRRYISGEMIGRWVMREWGITVERERGRSWPGLTVWEGFLESLLHDPAVYSTYPAQYHNLLRHLSLSHSLIVLFLRTLPVAAFPYAPPLPFDDELQLPPLHKSSSVGSFHSMPGSIGGRRFGSRPGSRAGSYAGSDAGGGMKMPRRERVTEVVMPEPLSAGPQDSVPALPLKSGLSQSHRRGSVGSIASVAPSFGFGRKRSNSVSSMQSAAFAAPPSAEKPATPVPAGKAAFPPVSYPTAKRYEFKRYGDQSTLSTSGNGGTLSRPGSIMSVQSGSVAHGGPMSSSRSVDTLAAPPPIGGSRRQARSSLTSSSSKRSDVGANGSNSPVQRRWDSPTQSMRVELAFERPPPYMTGRAPILRVFVPISDKVGRWPSADGAAATWRELEKCGASKRMRLGDLVVNTALTRPANTEHVLIYVPFVQHKLVPLEYVHSSTGHLPHYLDAFALSPTYYDPFLPTPQIIYLDFAPWATQAMNSVRLAYERRDHTTTSGARISAKRYLHVGGIEVKPGDRVAPEWQGMISLEAEGTAEGRLAMEARFGHGDPRAAVMGPWEVVRERSMLGSLWLRLIPETSR